MDSWCSRINSAVCAASPSDAKLCGAASKSKQTITHNETLVSDLKILPFKMQFWWQSLDGAAGADMQVVH